MLVVESLRVRHLSIARGSVIAPEIQDNRLAGCQHVVEVDFIAAQFFLPLVDGDLEVGCLCLADDAHKEDYSDQSE